MPTEIDVSQIRGLVLPNFADGEVPTLVAGTTATYQTANVPNPVTSVKPYLNGLRQVLSNGDFTAPATVAAGTPFQFTLAQALGPGDCLVIDYRY